MRDGGRCQAFILTASDHGTMIVSRMDWLRVSETAAIGVGLHILQHGSYEPDEVGMALGLLELRRRYYGDGVVAIDGGANIGVHTVEWAKHMHSWGKVLAVEAQERIYYALCGNVALNNCFNAVCVHAALAGAQGTLAMPVPNYEMPASFGSLALKGDNPDFGQEIKERTNVHAIALDGQHFERLDFIKLDVEGMELEVLEGAKATITEHHPIMLIEHIKTDREQLAAWLKAMEYEAYQVQINTVAVHRLDKCLDHVRAMAQQLGAPRYA